jgi:hypothetical protein
MFASGTHTARLADTCVTSTDLFLRIKAIETGGSSKHQLENPVRTSQETLRLRYKAQPVNAV